jgi:protein-tyrosine kinase
MSRNFELLQRADRVAKILPNVSPLIVPSNGHSRPHSDEIQPREEASKLVQRVFALPGTPGPRAVVFTGIGDGSGSPAVCAMAAEALAARGIGSVCVVDSNFRSPALHRWFEVDNLEGLADGLTHSGPIRELTRQIAAGNLWLLPCGSHSVASAYLAYADRLSIRLGELREEFDYVLITAPPADKYPEAIAIGKMADGVILVVEANSTPREIVQKTKYSLDSAEVRLLGAVLNDRTFPIPQAIYSKLK